MSPDVNDPGFRNISFENWSQPIAKRRVPCSKGGADLLLIETVFDTLNAKAALYAVDRVPR